MTNTLTPEWQPIRLPGECAPLGAATFAPTMVHERAALIAGGPLALTVFRVYDRQQRWYTVKARVWIRGYAVSASSVYVQDGCVLGGWDLTVGGCFGAINLATGEYWAPPSSDPNDPPPPPATPPDSLWTLPAPLADLQASVAAARHADTWACLLEQTEAVEAIVNADAAIANNYDPGGVSNLQSMLRTMLGSGNPSVRDPSLAANAHAALASAMSAAGTVVFSPPVVRSHQAAGVVAGEVFSLALDGTVHALDDTLHRVHTFSFAAPLRPELVMAELPQPGGRALCHLHYITADGGIAAIDGTVSPMRELPKWNGQGVPDPAHVLPLRAEQGLLFGGGILGADFFVTPADATLPIMRTVASPGGGWRNYDVAAAEQLVLLTDGSNTRLISFDVHAKVSDRWGIRAAPSASRSFFWAGTGANAESPTPRMMLELDVSAQGIGSAPGFRVMLADSVDSTNPALTSTYPPQPQPLDSVRLGPGKYKSLPSIGWIRSRPTVWDQSMYCHVRSVSPAAQIEAFITPDPATGDRPLDRWVQDVKQRVRGPDDLKAALMTIPIPVLTGIDAVVSFSLGAELGAVLPAAQSGLAQLRAMAQPVTIYVERVIRETYNGVVSRRDREPVPNWGGTLVLDPGGTRTLLSDDAARYQLDTKYAGASATLDRRSLTGKPVFGVGNAECSTCALQLGVTNTLTIEIPMITLDPSPHAPAPRPHTAS